MIGEIEIEIEPREIAAGLFPDLINLEGREDHGALGLPRLMATRPRWSSHHGHQGQERELVVARVSSSAISFFS